MNTTCTRGDVTADRKPVQQRKCRTCGEPEMVGLGDGAEFGWFDTEDGTWCNRCGSNPLAKPRRSKR